MMNSTSSLNNLSDSERKAASIKAYREKRRREREREQQKRFEATRYDPAAYIEKYLGWSPWSGTDDKPGQQQILDAYVLALKQQHEKRDYENGLLTEEQLTCWKPGQVIKNRILVEAGHTVGKTKIAAGIVSHFFDHFMPGVGYCFAPGFDQINDLLFKEIRVDREGKTDLYGKVLNTPAITHKANHFVKGKATSDAHGRGTERAQGQHEEYLIFVLDEAEGVADFVFNAIKSMTSGGISIVLMLANPRTRTSRFHKSKALSNVKSLRMSCIHHPNAIAGREIVPGAVKRDYVSEMLETNAEVVTEHNEDDHTFELDYDIRVGEVVHPKGTIFRPDSEFMFRVLGIAPANVSDDTLITVGRYEAACKRQKPLFEDNGRRATMGVDGARWGKDYGTLYVRHMNYVWREKQFTKKTDNPTAQYIRAIKETALRLAKGGVIFLHIRIDAAYGSGVIDGLRSDDELINAFFEFVVIEVPFGSSAYNKKAYYDIVTEMYAEANETMKGIKIVNAPEPLEADLCERVWEPRNVNGFDVKKLEKKEHFRKREKRSPDDGDGFVLCVAPDFLFDKSMSLSDIEIYTLDRESPYK